MTTSSSTNVPLSDPAQLFAKDLSQTSSRKSLLKYPIRNTTKSHSKKIDGSGLKTPPHTPLEQPAPQLPVPAEGAHETINKAEEGSSSSGPALVEKRPVVEPPATIVKPISPKKTDKVLPEKSITHTTPQKTETKTTAHTKKSEIKTEAPHYAQALKREIKQEKPVESTLKQSDIKIDIPHFAEPLKEDIKQENTADDVFPKSTEIKTEIPHYAQPLKKFVEHSSPKKTELLKSPAKSIRKMPPKYTPNLDKATTDNATSILKTPVKEAKLPLEKKISTPKKSTVKEAPKPVEKATILPQKLDFTEELEVPEKPIEPQAMEKKPILETSPVETKICTPKKAKVPPIQNIEKAVRLTPSMMGHKKHVQITPKKSSPRLTAFHTSHDSIFGKTEDMKEVTSTPNFETVYMLDFNPTSHFAVNHRVNPQVVLKLHNIKKSDLVSYKEQYNCFKPLISHSDH